MHGMETMLGGCQVISLRMSVLKIMDRVHRREMGFYNKGCEEACWILEYE